MKRGVWLRRRFELVKSRFENMFSRRDSAVVVDDAGVDTVAQHRAETEAKLEGKIKSPIPTTSLNNGTQTRRTSHAVRSSQVGRESARNSRLSVAGQHFAMAAVTGGLGQGLGFSTIDVQNVQLVDHAVSHRDGLFREDGGNDQGRTTFRRTTKRQSRFRYSMLDPTLGLGESVQHHEEDTTHSEQANFIRAMIESGNFDLQQLGLNKDSIDDPNFQTALHAALESFPPGIAAQIIEAAALHQETHPKEVERPVSPMKRARFSISIASKSAWNDIRIASNRWSRASSRRDSDIKLYDKPKFATRVWSRISWSRRNTDYIAY